MPTVQQRQAGRLGNEGMVRTQERELRRFRSFYLAYPQIRETLSPESLPALALPIRETVSPELGASGAPAPFPALLPQQGVQTSMPGQKLLECLSFSHFAELLNIGDPLQRAFYELECLRGNWSVRALQRQIGSLYFERSGLSLDKDKLSVMAHTAAELAQPRLAIRDPYVFEFLGLKPSETVAESDLEQAMLANLQEFLLELGHGFCLEARQKSILIGQTRGFVDQPAGRPAAVHWQRPRPCGICAVWHEQPAVCVQIPARTAQQRVAPTVFGQQAERSQRRNLTTSFSAT